MNSQSTQNPTTTVQVEEIGLADQTSPVKVLLVAGVAAGAAAGLIALLTEKKEEPKTASESARTYLREALAQAQSKDLAKMSRRQRSKAEKAIKKQKSKTSKDAEKLMKQARSTAADTASTVKGEASSLLDSLRAGSIDFERKVEDFAEGTLMAKLREFGDEAKVIAEQGKMKSAEAAQKAQSDVIPQAKDAAKHATEVGKERFSEVAEKARTEFIPAAQQYTSGLSDQAREKAGQVGADAEKLLGEAAHTADEKRKQASKAVKRGGRETRSLLLWVALAGILIFSVFLDEDQQKKLKEIAGEVFGEARDMYTDMKGNTN